MERRLMLSATAPELAPTTFTHLPLSRDAFVVTGAEAGSSPADGGWITLSLSGSNLNSVAANGFTDFSTSFDFDSANDTQVKFDASAYEQWRPDLIVGTNLSPPVIKSATSDLAPPNLTAFFTVTPVRNVESSPASSEGGSIAIGSVIAELKQQPAAPIEKSTSNHVVEAMPDSRHASHGSSPSPNLIPGEWGRASIFEMVNGAHSTDDQPTLNLERVKLRGDQSKSDVVLPLLLSGEAVTKPDPDIAHGGANQSQDEGQSPGSNQTSTAALDGEASTIDEAGALHAEIGLGENQPGKSLSSAAGMVAGTSVPTALELHGAGTSAVALAMDELGSVGKTTGSWARSRVTAAVVLVLALERVAAFNSREKNRRASDADEQASSRPKPIQRRPRAAL